MTREEEIISEGVEYTESKRPRCIGGQSYSYEIFQMNRNPVFEDAAKWADNTMIERVCAWLNSVNTDNYMDSGIFQMHDLIQDLKRVMEE